MKEKDNRVNHPSHYNQGGLSVLMLWKVLMVQKQLSCSVCVMPLNISGDLIKRMAEKIFLNASGTRIKWLNYKIS